jgi:hypothetical protein
MQHAPLDAPDRAPGALLNRSGPGFRDMPQSRKPFEVVLVAARAPKMRGATILPPQRWPATEPPIGSHHLAPARTRISRVESAEPSLDMRLLATAEVASEVVANHGLRSAEIISLAFARQRH